MNHLGAGVGLLVVVDDRHGVELAHGVVALQDATRILPGDGRASLDLCPGNLGIDARALAALRHKVINAALTVLVAGIPVLNGGVFDGGIVQSHQFHHRGVELILIAHGSRATFEVAHGRALVRDDQRALELAGVLGIDPKVGGKLHGAAHALGNVREGPVTKHGGVERGKEVVGIGDHGPEILAHQLGMLAHGFREGTENDAQLGELRLESGADGDAVKHRVHRHARQEFALAQRDAQLFVGLEQLRVDLLQALRARARLFRGGVVADGLVVNGGELHVRPIGLPHGQPVPIGLKAPGEHPFGLLLLGGDQTNNLFVQTRRDGLLFNVRDKTVLVFLGCQKPDVGLRCGHETSSL